MNTRTVHDLFTAAVERGEFAQAERALLEERQRALKEHDNESLVSVLQVLVQLYVCRVPPDLASAERFSLERELVDAPAYARLQTAFMFHRVARDPERTISKAKEAITLGKSVDDYGTVYTALSLLGQALLLLRRLDETRSALSELEDLLASDRAVMAADVTGFLEAAKAIGFEMERIRTLARRVAAKCTDPDFKRRLEAVAA